MGPILVDLGVCDFHVSPLCVGEGADWVTNRKDYVNCSNMDLRRKNRKKRERRRQI